MRKGWEVVVEQLAAERGCYDLKYDVELAPCVQELFAKGPSHV